MHDEASLRDKIKTLSSTVWEGRCDGTTVSRWLDNFNANRPDGVNERHQMLYLLSNFLYFGDAQIRELLRAQYEELFEKPEIQKIRKLNNDTTDLDFIDNQLRAVLFRTRFLGVGNPSESGQHLLYYFRQENRLSKNLFINHIELPGLPGATPLTCPPSVERYIFIDDLLGSGQQIVANLQTIIPQIRHLHPNVEILYFPLFATSSALQNVRASGLVNRVDCIMELDESFKCFSPDSRIYKACTPPLELSIGRDIADSYGSLLWPGHPLGYRDCQLALGFHHNTPDNSLPIFWFESAHQPPLPDWSPAFHRYRKF